MILNGACRHICVYCVRLVLSSEKLGMANRRRLYIVKRQQAGRQTEFSASAVVGVDFAPSLFDFADFCCLRNSTQLAKNCFNNSGSIPKRLNSPRQQKSAKSNNGGSNKVYPLPRPPAENSACLPAAALLDTTEQRHLFVRQLPMPGFSLGFLYLSLTQ